MTWCDSCGKVIADREKATTELVQLYRCTTCRNGDYDICNDYYASGKRCLESGHTLETRMPSGLWCRYDTGILARLRQTASSGKSTAARVACTGRVFFTTSRGLTGVGPRKIQPGDTVVVLFGARVPYVLRRKGNHYRLIGDCYVHGLVDGEAV
jgi:hypothetical protein